MALLAYSSPLSFPATLHNDETMGSVDNFSALVISKSASIFRQPRTSSPGLLNVHTSHDKLSTYDHGNLSDFPTSDQKSKRSSSVSEDEDSVRQDTGTAFTEEAQEAWQMGRRTEPAL